MGTVLLCLIMGQKNRPHVWQNSVTFIFRWFEIELGIGYLDKSKILKLMRVEQGNPMLSIIVASSSLHHIRSHHEITLLYENGIFLDYYYEVLNEGTDRTINRYVKDLKSWTYFIYLRCS